MSTQPAALPVRANSLALAFQDVTTVILRVRYRAQRVSDANAFRDSIRKMIASAASEARTLGYSDQTVQMALYAIVGFLDESILTGQDPVFAEWPRRPLQEEMFGGSFAGEYFFRNTNELLNHQESSEVADALELHTTCLLLGYRGKFAFGDNGEIAQLVRRIREKIDRIRGQLFLCRVTPAPEIAPQSTGDPWLKRLLFLTAAMALLVLLCLGGYWFLLSSSLNTVHTAALDVPALRADAGQPLASFDGGLAR